MKIAYINMEVSSTSFYFFFFFWRKTGFASCLLSCGGLLGPRKWIQHQSSCWHWIFGVDSTIINSFNHSIKGWHRITKSQNPMVGRDGNRSSVHLLFWADQYSLSLPNSPQLLLGELVLLHQVSMTARVNPGAGHFLQKPQEPVQSGDGSVIY